MIELISKQKQLNTPGLREGVLISRELEWLSQDCQTRYGDYNV